MTIQNRAPRAASICLYTVAGSILLVAACGGGGETSGPAASSPASKATQYDSSYAAGRISGFGSIVISGVHYDESNARILDEDGTTRSTADLKLGMIAEVQATNFGETDSVQTATAQSITFSSLIRGPVESKAGDTLVILGQAVKVTVTTVFDESLNGGLGVVAPGDILKVYGNLDTAAGLYTATRIERQSDPEHYGLRGSVTAYDTSTGTLSIGTAMIDVSNASLPDELATGSYVRLKLQTAQAGGKWVAISVKSARYAPEDSDHAEVEGTITAFTSATSFSVDGLPVDASKASYDSDDSGAGGLALGVRVEVEGPVLNGVLMAATVEIETEEDDRNEGFEVEGAVTSLDTVNSIIIVRGVTISFAGAVTFVGGSSADLRPDAEVEIHGMLAPGGHMLIATQIEFEDSEQASPVTPETPFY